MNTTLDLTYRLIPTRTQPILYHYRCGRYTFGANDVWWRRCGACYREWLERQP